MGPDSVLEAESPPKRLRLFQTVGSVKLTQADGLNHMGIISAANLWLKKNWLKAKILNKEQIQKGIIYYTCEECSGCRDGQGKRYKFSGSSCASKQTFSLSVASAGSCAGQSSPLRQATQKQKLGENKTERTEQRHHTTQPQRRNVKRTCFDLHKRGDAITAASVRKAMREAGLTCPPLRSFENLLTKFRKAHDITRPLGVLELSELDGIRDIKSPDLQVHGADVCDSSSSKPKVRFCMVLPRVFEWVKQRSDTLNPLVLQVEHNIDIKWKDHVLGMASFVFFTDSDGPAQTP